MRDVQSRRHPRRSAFTLIELLVVISIVALLVGILLPAIGMARDTAKQARSMSNLRNFGTVYANYAADWNGRQWTNCPDNLSTLIGGYPQRFPLAGPAGPANVPSVPLGFDRYGNEYETRVARFILAMWAPPNCSQGSFRYFQTRPFSQYLNGKYFDSIFWADKDYTINEEVHELEADPGQWPGPDPPNTTSDSDPYPYASSYCHSVAAMVSPAAYARDSIGGAVHPLTLPAGHRSPGLGQARYPDLKTHMLEHYWLQNNPTEQIPGTNGVPWFFNMGLDSTPATLFYDSHVRMMSVREAVQSDQRAIDQGADSLVASSDPACFGGSGYFEWYSYGDQEVNSYHVFTADGILGRDTTGGSPN